MFLGTLEKPSKSNTEALYIVLTPSIYLFELTTLAVLQQIP